MLIVLAIFALVIGSSCEDEDNGDYQDDETEVWEPFEFTPTLLMNMIRSSLYKGFLIETVYLESSRMRTSVRRFFCRPSSVLLPATG